MTDWSKKSLIFKCCSHILKTAISADFFVKLADTYQNIDAASSIEASVNHLARASIIDGNRGKWKVWAIWETKLSGLWLYK